MSVESDTLHYYAELDREQARDERIDFLAEQLADEEIRPEVYDWLTERFGENTAITLTDPEGYTDAEVMECIHDARAHFSKWLRQTAENQATETVEA